MEATMKVVGSKAWQMAGVAMSYQTSNIYFATIYLVLGSLVTGPIISHKVRCFMSIPMEIDSLACGSIIWPMDMENIHTPIRVSISVIGNTITHMGREKNFMQISHAIKVLSDGQFIYLR
jgi:hypothetical protein